jgi:hypothetical protein
MLEYRNGGQITEPSALPDFDCRVVYRAQAGFGGEDSFTFNADDSGTGPMGGQSNVATAKVTVKFRTVTLTFEVADGRDDGSADPKSSWNDLSAARLKMGVRTSALRFTDVDVPRGSKIVKARLLVGMTFTATERVEGIIQAEATGNAVLFTGAERYLCTLPRTTASVAWVWEPPMSYGHYPS